VPTRKGYTQLEFPKELAAILVIESRRLGFSSVSSYVEVLNKTRLKNAWSALDLKIISEYGLEAFLKLSKSLITSPEELEKEGYKKIADSEGKQFTETMPPIIAEVKPKTEKRIVTLGKTPLVVEVEPKPKKKSTKPQKTTVSTENMPTSEQFFKGDK
jgi:hypothetical protein